VRLAPDLDYHLVIADEKGRTMIVESPDPKCVRSGILASPIKTVRSKIDQTIRNVPRTGVQPNVLVTVEGVGFFDTFAGLLGQAPNGVELHPVTKICFGKNCKL
jgi:hypothetical protein